MNSREKTFSAKAQSEALSAEGKQGAVKKTNMWIKVLVAVIGISFSLSVAFFTPVWSATLLNSVLCILIVHELTVPTGYVNSKFLRFCAYAFAAAVPWLYYFDKAKELLLILMFAQVVICFSYAAFSGIENGAKQLIYVFFASFIFPLFFALIVPILKMDNGKVLIIIPFAAAWGSDTFAQFTGKLLGKHKFAPAISPNKTTEGVIGGILGGGICLLIFAIVTQALGMHFNKVLLIAFGIIGSALSELGDLFFSFIKRDCGIKDFGSFMPEHGGFLDRFDSVIFTMPVFYIIINYIY